MLSNNELAGIGMGFGVGAGAALVSPSVGLGIGGYGIGMLLLAIWRDSRENDDTDEVATDGGTAQREPQPESASKQPVVLDIEVEGDRVLGGAERGDVAVVVEAPAGISEEELAETLDDLPERMTRTAELFDGGDA